MKQPRLLFVGPMLGRHPGYVSNPAEELAPRLTQSGYQCWLTSSHANRYLRLLDIVGTILRLRNKVELVSLQVYSGPSFVVEDIASWLVKHLGLRLVMVLHGGGMPDFMHHFPHWFRRVLSRADCIVAPSAFLSDAVALYGFHARIIPNAISLENYPFKLRDRIQPRILWMRTFHEIYNPCMAVEVLARLVFDFPQSTLTMAGQEKGSLQKVQAQVSEKHLDTYMRFAGFLDTSGKQVEFQRHDVFLNTNRVDNMPISVIEALAFGMPVIATAVGGVPYLIQNNENGLLVPSDDVDAMTNAVRRLIGEPGLAGRLSTNARKFAETHDWSIVLPMWASLFQEIMEQQA